MTRRVHPPNRLAWLLALFVAAPAACGPNTPTTPTPPGAFVGDPSNPPNAVTPVRYELTVTAGLPCGVLEGPLRDIATATLPADVHSRRYSAGVTRGSDGRLLVDVSGSNLTPFGFGLITNGDRVEFMIDGPAFFERLPTFSYLEIFGSGTATVADLDSQQITIPFSGAFEYCALNSPMNLTSNNCYTTPPSRRKAYAVCHSSTHLMTLTRR